MFQPLIECLSRFGVTQFNLQVSGSPENTQVIICPVLSAAVSHSASPDQHFRALLTTPVVVVAPIGEIDTKLAEILEQYADELGIALDDNNVSKRLRKAAIEAETLCVASKSKPSKSKPVASNKTPSSVEPQEVAAPAAPADPVADDNEPSMFDDDVLKSLGL